MWLYAKSLGKSKVCFRIGSGQELKKACAPAIDLINEGIKRGNAGGISL